MSTKITVNAALEWKKTLENRQKELTTLRDANSKKEDRYYGQSQTAVRTEPVYDVVKLDSLVTAVATEIRKVTTAIIAHNASAQLEGYEMDESVLGNVAEAAKK